MRGQDAMAEQSEGVVVAYALTDRRGGEGCSCQEGGRGSS